MIDPNKLDAVTTIVVHDHCPDGMASAILLKDAYYAQHVDILFMKYGSDELKALPATPGMLFCDFSPPADRAEEFVQAGAIVLDHHKTAKDTVTRFEHSVFGDEVADPGVCGAVLAFRHVWLPRRGNMLVQRLFAEDFATLAGIRDTWQRQSPRWQEACNQAYILNFFPPGELLASKTLTHIAARWKEDYLPIGKILAQREADKIQSAIQKGLRCTSSAGRKVIIFPGTGSTSDAAEALGAEVDLVVGFECLAENGRTKVIFSTRSHTDFDCSAFCKSYGGGGHTRAAGFSMDLDDCDPQPFAFFRNLLDQWEASKSVASAQHLP